MKDNKCRWEIYTNATGEGKEGAGGHREVTSKAVKVMKGLASYHHHPLPIANLNISSPFIHDFAQHRHNQ